MQVGQVSRARARARIAYWCKGIAGVCERLACSRIGSLQVLRDFGASVGASVIYGHLQITNPGSDLSNLTIAEKCSVGVGVLFDLAGKVVVEDRAVLAMRAMVLTHQEMGSTVHVDRGYERVVGETRIGADAYVGAGAIVLAGCTVGERSIVAAGSVVTEDVPADSVVAGVPAKVVKSF